MYTIYYYLNAGVVARKTDAGRGRQQLMTPRVYGATVDCTHTRTYLHQCVMRT